MPPKKLFQNNKKKMHPFASLFEDLKANIRTAKDNEWIDQALKLATKLISVNQFRLAKNLLLVSETKRGC